MIVAGALESGHRISVFVETGIVAVGVFDSGVGGLSVLREIRALLPELDLMYVADSAHCPYGSKSEAEIRGRAEAIAAFFVRQGASAIVVACNTATAAAIDGLRLRFGDVPFVGMEPAVKPAVTATRSGVVGVLATGATLGADRFTALAARFGVGADHGEDTEGVELLTRACPGLVEQVEAGDLDGPRTRSLLRKYVTPLVARGADTLVLGCTHYPFLRPALVDLVGPNITLIDTGAAVARQLGRVLGEERVSIDQGLVRFFTSDLRAAPVLRRLWGEPVEIDLLPV